VVLVAVLPAAIPLLFGSAFSDAVWPAVIIAIAGTAYAPQLTLATAAAARRLPRAHLRSFAASVLSMVALDAAFVPAWGGTGAAMATMVSALVGLAVIVVDLRRAGLLTLAELRPGRRDVVELVGVLRALRRG
jgi:O-antigen/teichoic acid export membrane protein